MSVPIFWDNDVPSVLVVEIQGEVTVPVCDSDVRFGTLCLASSRDGVVRALPIENADPPEGQRVQFRSGIKTLDGIVVKLEQPLLLIRPEPDTQVPAHHALRVCAIARKKISFLSKPRYDWLRAQRAPPDGGRRA